MTHRVHPYSFRLVQLRPWKSRWFNLKKFKDYLREDTLVREWLWKKFKKTHIESIDVERSPNTVHFILKTSRPGLIIGRGGDGAEALKREIEKKIRSAWKHELKLGKKLEKQNIKLSILEVSDPDLSAAINAELIVEELEKRLPFRRVLKQSIERMSSRKEILGVKVSLKGRLDGAEMARYEWLKKGRIPLQTIRADIDYAETRAETAYGIIGVKVWLYKGDVFNDPKSKV